MQTTWTRTLRCRSIIVLAVLIAARTTAEAADKTAGNAAYGSSSALRQDALRTVPLSRLTPQGKTLATKVINDTTVFRRLPTQVLECDAELYTFLIEHPDLVINIWEVMGVTKVQMQKIGPASFQLDDGHGTVGKIHYLHRSPSQHVVYCEGTYTGSMFPRPIRGRCLISLRSAAVRDADERQYVQCRLDSFVQLDNIGIELFAKTFHNVLGGIADHNLREVSNFVASVSEAAEASPENLHRIADKCSHIPEQTRQQFVDISDRIYQQSMGLAKAGDAPAARAATPSPETAIRRPFSSEPAKR